MHTGHITSWRLDEITGREGYEALVARLAGDTLTGQLDAARRARLALQEGLGGAQRDHLITYADAATDAACTREEAAAAAGLCYGVAIGAALARFPDEASDAVIGAAARAAEAVLGSALSLGVADGVARVALDALAPRA